jgi:hypothetical protein
MHRLGKCDSEQARAEDKKTGNGYSEDTVRSEFFMCHGTPPTARQCWLPPAVGSSRLAARLERLRLMTQLYVGKRPIPKGIGRVIRRFVADSDLIRPGVPTRSRPGFRFEAGHRSEFPKTQARCDRQHSATCRGVAEQFAVISNR